MKRSFFIIPFLAVVAGVALAACSGDPEVIIEERIVEVEKIVEVAGETKTVTEIVEVEVEKIVEVAGETKTVTETVEVEKIVEVAGETVTEIVEVEKIVTVEVEVEREKVLIATPTPVAAGVPRFGGTLRIVAQGSIASIDPVWSVFYVTNAVASHIYETPFGWDNRLDTRARLVDTWSLGSDNLTYTFDLRAGVTFHDGTALTSADVVPSMLRWRDSPVAATSIARTFIEEDAIRAVDNNTFTITLNEPMGSLLYLLGMAHGTPYIQPAELAATPATTEVTTRIGTGAYKFLEWDFGNKLTLERYDAYVPRTEPDSNYTGRSIAYVDQIVWLEIPDPETAVAGLETGEWDAIDGAGFDFFKRFTENPDLAVSQYKPGNHAWLALNPQISPFNDRKARQALLAGVNAEDFMFSLGPEDLWIKCGAVYFCGTPLEVETGLEFYDQNDMARAQALLAESSYAGETVVILNPTDYATITPLGLVAQPMMDEIGFNTEMPALDWAAVTSNIGNTGTYSMFTAWSAHFDTGHPIMDINISGTIDWMIRDEELTDLQLAFVRAPDPAAQMDIVREIQRQYFEKVPSVALGQFFPMVATTSALKNFEINALPFYTNTWLER
jgi:peptide/nickel transport system substrate-binding protein